MSDLTMLALNQATTRSQWGFRESVEGYARAGVRSIAVWTNKVAECGLAEARALLDSHGMKVPGYCSGEMTGVLTPARADQLYDKVRGFLDEGAALGADCFVMMLGAPSDRADSLAESRKRATELLARLLPHARERGIVLGIEPVHPMRAGDLACVNTLRQANAMCDQLGAGAGIVVDTYHVWWDPDVAEGIRAASGRICAFQVSDWLVPTTYVSNERGMPGDGIIDIAGIWRMVRQAGYQGPCEIELMSERDWWLRDPDEVVRVCVERFGALRRQIA